MKKVTEKKSKKTKVLYVVEFKNKKEAKKYAGKFVFTFSFQDRRVIRYRNGVPIADKDLDKVCKKMRMAGYEPRERVLVYLPLGTLFLPVYRYKEYAGCTLLKKRKKKMRRTEGLENSAQVFDEKCESLKKRFDWGKAEMFARRGSMRFGLGRPSVVDEMYAILKVYDPEEIEPVYKGKK